MLSLRAKPGDPARLLVQADDDRRTVAAWDQKLVHGHAVALAPQARLIATAVTDGLSVHPGAAVVLRDATSLQVRPRGAVSAVAGQPEARPNSSLKSRLHTSTSVHTILLGRNLARC
jgi:hypothetical protein